MGPLPGRYVAAPGRQLGRAGLLSLYDEVSRYPTVQALPDAPEPARPSAPTLLLPCVLRTPQRRLSMFTTLTTFGTPRDVTLDELCVELFYPADAASQVMLRSGA